MIKLHLTSTDVLCTLDLFCFGVSIVNLNNCIVAEMVQVIVYVAGYDVG